MEDLRAVIDKRETHARREAILPYIKRRYSDGLGLKLIMNETKVPMQTLHRWLRSEGVTLRPSYRDRGRMLRQQLDDARSAVLFNPFYGAFVRVYVDTIVTRWNDKVKRQKERQRQINRECATRRRRLAGMKPLVRKTDAEKREANRRWRLSYDSNPVNRIRRGLRIRLGRFLTGKQTFSLSKLVGCSPEHLKAHLESQFRPGMTWENYGSAWHVDHIVPLARFDLTDPAQREAAANWRNLQPLFAAENLRKNATVPEGVAPSVPVVMLDHLDAIISKQELEREITAKMVADYVAGVGIRTLSTRYAIPKTTVQRRLKASGAYIGIARKRTNVVNQASVTDEADSSDVSRHFKHD